MPGVKTPGPVFALQVTKRYDRKPSNNNAMQLSPCLVALFLVLASSQNLRAEAMPASGTEPTLQIFSPGLVKLFLIDDFESARHGIYRFAGDNDPKTFWGDVQAGGIAGFGVPDSSDSRTLGQKSQLNVRVWHDVDDQVLFDISAQHRQSIIRSDHSASDLFVRHILQTNETSLRSGIHHAPNDSFNIGFEAGISQSFASVGKRGYGLALGGGPRFSLREGQRTATALGANVYFGDSRVVPGIGSRGAESRASIELTQFLFLNKGLYGALGVVAEDIGYEVYAFQGYWGRNLRAGAFWQTMLRVSVADSGPGLYYHSTHTGTAEGTFGKWWGWIGCSALINGELSKSNSSFSRYQHKSIGTSIAARARF